MKFPLVFAYKAFIEYLNNVWIAQALDTVKHWIAQTFIKIFVVKTAKPRIKTFNNAIYAKIKPTYGIFHNKLFIKLNHSNNLLMYGTFLKHWPWKFANHDGNF